MSLSALPIICLYLCFKDDRALVILSERKKITETTRTQTVTPDHHTLLVSILRLVQNDKTLLHAQTLHNQAICE